MTQRRILAALVAVTALFAIASDPLAFGASDKVTICHATSSETNPYVTLEISEHAVYGPGGHFLENGTTQAGHEQDHMGPCDPPPCPNPTPEPTPDVTPAPTPDATPEPTPEPTPEVTPAPTPDGTPPGVRHTPEPRPVPTVEPELPPTDTVCVPA